MTPFVLLVAKHALLLTALLAVAAAAGSVLARGESLALRGTLGLAALAQTYFVLALCGVLRPVPLAIATLVWVVAGLLRMDGLRRRSNLQPRIAKRFAVPLLVLAGAFLIALRPPLAFDETLYHLPFVRALIANGQMRFLADVRFGAFPQLHELLCVPLMMIGGDVATHLVALAEMLLLAALLYEWGRRASPAAGALALALFAGSPIVLQLATITYTDAALALFVTAGFFCIDRSRLTDSRLLALSGLLFGTACSVKYLGWFFVVSALVIVVAASTQRLRAAAIFASCSVTAALPTTGWIVLMTGNPVFPFFSRVFGATAWSVALPQVSAGTRVARTLRLAWNVTFARQHVNGQPPFTPFFIVMLVALLFHRRGRIVAGIAAACAIVFSFLPQDSRYLVSLLPLVSLAAAETFDSAIARRDARDQLRMALPLIAIAPGLLYVVYSLAVRGLPPATPAQREAMLRARVPGYAVLTRATGTVYVCGAEQLNYYAPAKLLGDFYGPFSYDRVLSHRDSTTAVAASIRNVGARYYLASKDNCSALRNDGGMSLVVEDEHAQLWEVQGSQSAPQAPRTRAAVSARTSS